MWQDEEGNLLGNDQSIQVDKNGTYYVRAELENKDVDEEGLSSRILVDNIYKAQPAASIKPTSSPGELSGTPSPSPVSTSAPSKAPSAPAPSKAPATPDPTKMPVVSAASGEEGAENASVEESREEENEAVMESVKETILEETEGEEGSPSGGIKKPSSKAEEKEQVISPADTKPLIKETRKAPLPEKEAEGKIPYKAVQEEKRDGFFNMPAVRIITITAGAALLLAGLVLMFMYLMRSVKIYNDDGKGRMIYLGRCLAVHEEDVYTLTITEAMVEKAYTNRYCIKPGLFRIGKKEGQELLIRKGAKSTAVYLSREIVVVI